MVIFIKHIPDFTILLEAEDPVPKGSKASACLLLEDVNAPLPKGSELANGSS